MLQERGQLVHPQKGIVADRRLRHGDNVEIGCGVGLEVHVHESIPEHLVEPGPALLGRGQRLASFDSAQYVEQIRSGDLKDRPLPERREDVLFEDPVELRQRALPARFQAMRLEVAPALEDGFEGVVGGEGRRPALLAAMGAGIDPFGDEGARLVAPLTRVLEADLRVGAERDPDLLAVPVEAEMPVLSALGAHEQREAIHIGQREVLAGGAYQPDRGICQCHCTSPVP